jgi:hypothetical protein
MEVQYEVGVEVEVQHHLRCVNMPQVVMPQVLLQVLVDDADQHLLDMLFQLLGEHSELELELEEEHNRDHQDLILMHHLQDLHHHHQEQQHQLLLEQEYRQQLEQRERHLHHQLQLEQWEHLHHHLVLLHQLLLEQE